MKTSARIIRKTKETSIELSVSFEERQSDIKTGLGFFDHMLNSFAVHSGLGLKVNCAGDLEVDGHHTVEDAGICLGKAIGELLEDKSGIARFGESRVPMDEALASCVLDLSGRAYLHFDASFPSERIGGYDSCLTKEFFRAVAANAGITLHLSLLYGENAHHMTEALFKAFARALAEAVSPKSGLLSAKGVL